MSLRPLPVRWLAATCVALPCLVSTCLGCSGAAPLPPAALTHNSSGADALASGDLETASANLDVALEYNPEFVEALTNLGLVEMNRGNFVRARQLLERARRLNPDIAQPHHGLGVLAEREHRRDRASDHYREALRVDPGFAAARANLGRLLLEAGHVEHALDEYRKLRQVDPASDEGHSGYIDSLLRLGRAPEAHDALRLAGQLLGDHPRLRVLAARLEARASRTATAARLLGPVAERDDDHGVEARAWLAVLELSEGRAEAALNEARSALALDPDHPLALYAMALALSDLSAPEAGAWLERALAANPGNPEITKRIVSDP